MLGTAEAYALRAKAYGNGSVMRIIGIGADGKPLMLVSHLHYAPEIAAVRIGGNGGDKNIIDAAC